MILTPEMMTKTTTTTRTRTMVTVMKTMKTMKKPKVMLIHCRLKGRLSGLVVIGK
jgi:hypothetical protein